MPVREYYGLMADLISASSSYMLAIVAIVTVVIAGLELGKWRAELLGRASHDAAKKLYIAAKRWQYAYHGARVPFRSISVDSDEPRTNETPAAQSKRLFGEQEFQLLDALRVATLAVEEASWEVETSSEVDTRGFVSPLIGYYRELRRDVYEFYELQDESTRSEADNKRLSQLRRHIYGVPDDAHGRAAETDVAALLTACRSLALGKIAK